jgi:cell division septum initiation protein DivIVA
VATTEAVSPRSGAPDVATQGFALIRRGYDPQAVDVFVASVGEQIARLQGEVEWLRARSEHFERRSASATEAAYARMARQLVDLVRKADQAVQQVRTEAKHEAGRLVGLARAEADRILMEARQEAEAVLTSAAATATAGPSQAQRDGSGDLLRAIWRSKQGRPTVEAWPDLNLDVDIQVPSIDLDDQRLGP